MKKIFLPFLCICVLSITSCTKPGTGGKSTLSVHVFEGVCDGSSVIDICGDCDGDGSTCEGEIVGCMDASACNFKPEATFDNGTCLETDCLGECGGGDFLCTDCNGIINGSGVLDNCGECVEPLCATTTSGSSSSGVNPCDGDEFPTNILWNASCLSSQNPVPKNFRINKIYPNPFNPQTNIEYSNDRMEKVSIKIYNLKGEHVETLVDSHISVGQHQASWNGANHSTGIYFVRLSSGNKITTKKIILLK